MTEPNHANTRFRPEATVTVTTDFLNPATQPLLTERELGRLSEGFCPFHPESHPRKLDAQASCGGWRWQVEDRHVYCFIHEESFCRPVLHGDPRDEGEAFVEPNEV